jgi:hypothetical protein
LEVGGTITREFRVSSVPARLTSGQKAEPLIHDAGPVVTVVANAVEDYSLVPTLCVGTFP